MLFLHLIFFLKNKTVLATARKEVAQSKRAVEVCQAEFTSLKTECAHLQLLLNEERRKYMDLDGQNRKLLSEIDTHKKNEVQHNIIQSYISYEGVPEVTQIILGQNFSVYFTWNTVLCKHLRVPTGFEVFKECILNYEFRLFIKF